ncbi:acid--CoA ligase [Roseibium aquae]|uniref:Acid--CoA ligase n=1 Tax=Roseibium aquae TaxID=1323746 RepID=A0A916T7V4_9HYPH|nr:AMP-binding protein [Roseibium aquae]GGB34040.1 acid--CoA ligase [Roseibium aquae]
MSIASWIDKHAAFTPGKAALVFEGETITYAALARRIEERTGELSGRFGLSQGDRVAYLGHNSPEFLILLFACARHGAIFLPLNWRLAPEEHGFILSDAGAKLLIAEPAFHPGAENLRHDLPDCRFVSTAPSGPDWACLGQSVAAERHVDDGKPEDAVLLVYTSGTTGYPKGAVLTQDALQWNAFNSLHMHDMTSQDRILSVLPMFHVGGLNIQTLPALYAGGTVYLHAKFDPAETLAAIARDRPDLTVLVPATMAAVLAHADFQETDLSSLRSLTTGSSTVPKSLILAFHNRSIPVLQVYGSTETCPIAVYLKPEDAFRHLGTTGKPGLHCEMKIIDNAGRTVRPGEAGEIAIKGPNIMREYWNNPQATADALKEGWFFTGDIGFIDPDGYLVVNDRKKDVIISGGENIYPAEVERLLMDMDDIAQAVVVGEADEKWGEVPVAVVVPTAGCHLDVTEIMARFSGRIARFKHPKRIHVADSLPVNAMGKIQRFAVRELLLADNFFKTGT